MNKPLSAVPFDSGALHRRAFLKTTAGFAGALAFSHVAVAESKRPLRKAIMYSTIGIAGTPLEKFRAMKEAGFEGVEPMGGMNREDVQAALQETGLGAASVCCHTHWVKPLSAPDEATRKIGFDGLVHSLQDAKAYGANSVLLVPGAVRNGVTFKECYERSLMEIKKAIPVARDLGVKIAIENVGNDFITTPEQAAEYLDAINSEWVGWHFDIGNAGRYGPSEKWFQVLGKRILKIHVKEYSAATAVKTPQKAPPRPKLLDGQTNWPAVMRAIDQSGYRGWAISEQPGPQAASVEEARDLAQRMDKIFAL